MKDTDVLKKLYELQGLKPSDRDEYITSWINDTKIAISEESAKTVGAGDAFKAFKSIIKANAKDKPDLAFALRSSDKYDFVITDGAQAIRFKSKDCKLPTTSLKVEFADKIVKYCDDYRGSNTKCLIKPTRAELDTIIKEYKALPKKERGAYPIYDFGEGLPQVNAEKLMNISCCFPTNDCMVDPSKGTNSPLFFHSVNWEGILMPIRKG